MKTVSPREAVAALRAGKVALVPTETVVGLVAAESGLPRVREIKGRDADKPIALLCASAEEAFGLAANVPPLARETRGTLLARPSHARLGSPLWRDHRSKGARRQGRAGPARGLRRPTLRHKREPLRRACRAALDDVDPQVLEAVDVVVEGEPGSGEASAVVDLSKGNVRLVRATRELSTQRLARLATE